MKGWIGAMLEFSIHGDPSLELSNLEGRFNSTLDDYQYALTSEQANALYLKYTDVRSFIKYDTEHNVFIADDNLDTNNLRKFSALIVKFTYMEYLAFNGRVIEEKYYNQLNAISDMSDEEFSSINYTEYFENEARDMDVDLPLAPIIDGDSVFPEQLINDITYLMGIVQNTSSGPQDLPTLISRNLALLDSPAIKAQFKQNMTTVPKCEFPFIVILYVHYMYMYSSSH